jgi:hypothetical protein
MPEIHPKPMWQVNIIESERGWGQKIDETKYFDNEVEARQFVKHYNAQNTAPSAPDWYMYCDNPVKVC